MADTIFHIFEQTMSKSGEWKTFQSLPWSVKPELFRNLDISNLEHRVSDGHISIHSDDIDFADQSDLPSPARIDSKFKLLAHALTPRKQHIVVPKESEGTIEITLQSSQNEIHRHTIFYITIGAESDVSLVYRHNGSAEESFENIYIVVLQEDHARVSFTSIQEVQTELYCNTDVEFHLMQNARLNFQPVITGGATDVSTYDIHLLHEGAETDNRMIFLGNGNQYYHHRLNNFHHTHHTVSNTRCHGVLNDFAASYMEGMIKIVEKAQESESDLTQRTLLLSEMAKQDTIPRLEVESNDVTAGHAASVSKIDEDELFYANTRGIEVREARFLIVKGFLESLYFDAHRDIVDEAILAVIDKKII